ncbi:MAG: single-stranded DNA-binding protein, partial [Chloroflexi bacterium]|nr:single-stranded DNA-binding protein [Chloroflexota bacterium]
TFRQLAERCNEMVTKGAQIYVDGRLQSREWEGQDGQKRRSLDILANTVVFLTNRGRGAAPDGDDFGDVSAPTPLRPQPSRAATAHSPANAGFGDDGDLPPDDLPF